MSYEPIAGHLAVRLTQQIATSARPDAPVVPDPEPRPSRVRAVRAGLATELRAVARWVEPASRSTEACQPG